MDSFTMRWNNTWFSVGALTELHIGKAEIYVSGKMMRFALRAAACLMNETALSVVAREFKKTGETWHAATRIEFAILMDQDYNRSSKAIRTEVSSGLARVGRAFPALRQAARVSTAEPLPTSPIHIMFHVRHQVWPDAVVESSLLDLSKYLSHISISGFLNFT
jgi:hypothetical protein